MSQNLIYIQQQAPPHWHELFLYPYILTTGHTFTDFEIEKIGVIVDMLLTAGIVKLTNQS